MCLNEIYSKVHISIHLPDSYRIQYDLKQGYVFDFVLDYAIKEVQVNQMLLKLIGTRQLLARADDMNLLGDKYYKEKKTEV
jgi:hypothetical protein